MKRVLSVIAASVLILSAIALGGCSSSPLTGDELREVAEPLIEASAEINEIYFGAGLSSDEPEDFEAGASPRYFNVTDEKYSYVEDIKEATALVYSEEYCSYLYSVAFEGFDTDAGTVYARYIDGDYGNLTELGGIAAEAMTLGRVYDYDTIAEVSHTSSSVTFTVDTVGGDGTPLNVKLKIVLEENGWRLDDPTY
jgi:hypothetical protein